jgi:hypothetical protein
MKNLVFVIVLLITACQPARVISTPIQGIATPTAEEWRVPMMPGIDYAETDLKNTEVNKKYVEEMFPVFNITPPVSWDCYTLNDANISPFAIPKYYESILSRRGYQVNHNAYDPKIHNGTAVYTKDKSTIYLKFSAGLNDVKKLPVVMVFYKKTP